MSTPQADSGVRLTRRGRVITLLIALALVLAVASLAGLLYLRGIGVLGSSDPGERVEFAIPQGASAEEIGKILEQEGVVTSAFGFRLAVFLEGGGEAIQAGRYELRTNLTARDALGALAKGPVIEFVSVTFPEGSWLTDFATTVDRRTHLSAEKFLRLAQGRVRSGLQPEEVNTLEGLLFPSTYQVVESDTERSVLKRLIGQMEKETAAVDFESKAEALGITPYEALVVASMIEGEASAAGDRDRIARVIYNRIEMDMKLEIDATVLYALGEHKEELTRSDLDVDSPYNTRRYPGIPPTPIGAPGAASLAAAVNPAEGDWLFYVLADCDGNHFFTDDYNAFLRQKAEYQALDC
ncbi:MAG TPA: endolytic transglycosylase MltG [Actinomycetota bacterium]|nr:endolytic transglycosylase MltG [Actinomycetota bacterium]